MGSKLSNYCSLIGSVASIIAILILPNLSIYFGIIIFCILSFELIRYLKRDYFYGRDNVVRNGNRLIKFAKEEVIMFGNDISWASDYEESIRTITSNNKKVIIYYVNNASQKTNLNIERLKQAGAITKALKKDLGLRGTLIDPELSYETLLFLVHRRNKVLNSGIIGGDKGNDDISCYSGRLIKSRNKDGIMNIFNKVHKNIDIVLEGDVNE